MKPLSFLEALSMISERKDTIAYEKIKARKSCLIFELL